MGKELSDASRIGHRTDVDGEVLMPSQNAMRNLAILILAAVPGWSAMGAHFNILDYGAKNDGSAPGTEAFRAAIQAANAAGGGTVFVPAGEYNAGPQQQLEHPAPYFEAGGEVETPAQALACIE